MFRKNLQTLSIFCQDDSQLVGLIRRILYIQYKYERCNCLINFIVVVLKSSDSEIKVLGGLVWVFHIVMVVEISSLSFFLDKKEED